MATRRISPTGHARRSSNHLFVYTPFFPFVGPGPYMVYPTYCIIYHISCIHTLSELPFLVVIALIAFIIITNY